MRESPVYEFKSQEQLDEYLYKWKNILGLQGWMIKACVVGKDNMPLEDSAGVNEFNIPMMQSIIYILDPRDYEDDTIDVYLAEKILVHELLHLVVTCVDRDDRYESKVVDLLEHQRVEKMAKSLIKARYYITDDDFYRQGYSNPNSIFTNKDILEG